MHWRYHYFTSVYQKYWYDLQFWRYKVLQIEIGNYGSFFALLSPLPWKPKKSEFQKNKDCWRYHHLTHVHHHHFTHVYQNPLSWVMVPEIWSERQEFFRHFGPFFLPFFTTIWKIKILNKRKKHLEMSSFYTRVPKITTILYMLLEIRSATDIIFCHFVLFLPFYPTIGPKN